jgi:hypothetical protein
MKKNIGLLLLSLLCLSSSAQMLVLETGKYYGNFNYKNSAGESLGNLTGSIQNNLGIGVRQPLFKSPCFLSLGALYNQYFVSGSDPLLGTYYEWNLTNLGVNLGADYEFLRPSLYSNERHGFSIILKGEAMADFLLKGKQRLNNQVYDLKGIEEFDRPVWFLRGGASANYYLSKTFMVFARYMLGKSFLIGDYKDKEQLRYLTHNVSIGLMINLIYVK